MNDAEKIIFSLIQSGMFSVRDDGTIWRNFYASMYKNSQKNKILPARAEYKNCGYFELIVTVDGKRYRAKAHRIVWMFFNGDIPDGLLINHINGKRPDNRPENLEVVTNKENIDHAYRIGLAHGRPGMAHHLVKITDDDVREIRRLYSVGGISQRALGKSYNLSQGQIGRIIRGERWKTV